MPQQSELSKVAHSSDLFDLHCASGPTTGDVHSFGAIKTQFCRLSRKGHTPTWPPSAIHASNLANISSGKSLGQLIER
jgi:hypothetical protein